MTSASTRARSGVTSSSRSSFVFDGTICSSGTSSPVAAWLAWLVVAVSLVLEVVSQVRGLPTPTLPGLGAPQRAVGQLVAVAALLFVAAPTVVATFPTPPARAVTAPVLEAPRLAAVEVAPLALNARDGHPWDLLYEAATDERANYGDFAPGWVYPGSAKIERHVAPLALSSDRSRYERVRRDVSLYRLTFGQPRQEDMLELLSDDTSGRVAAFRISLSPSDLRRSDNV